MPVEDIQLRVAFQSFSSTLFIKSTFTIRLQYMVISIIKFRGTVEIELLGALVTLQDLFKGLGKKVPILARYTCKEQVIVKTGHFIKDLSN